jgi:hypothetical protein
MVHQGLLLIDRKSSNSDVDGLGHLALRNGTAWSAPFVEQLVDHLHQTAGGIHRRRDCRPAGAALLAAQQPECVSQAMVGDGSQPRTERPWAVRLKGLDATEGIDESLLQQIFNRQ